MIDKESQVFTGVKNAISSVCTNASTTYQNSPSSFPYLYLKQIDNSTTAEDMENSENAVISSIEIHVYTTGSGALSKNKSVFKLADAKMREFGFQRKYYAPVDNLTDTQITHYVGRYSRIVCDEDIL